LVAGGACASAGPAPNPVVDSSVAAIAETAILRACQIGVDSFR
jgi:hypothetical protein